MFIDDAHILRASSSTVCACISKRPAIARIECGSVIKRVAMLADLLLISFLDSSYRFVLEWVCYEATGPGPSRLTHRQSGPLSLNRPPENAVPRCLSAAFRSEVRLRLPT